MTGPTGSSARPLRLGARTSPLAMAQAQRVAERLEAAGHRTEFVGITTTGDLDRRHLTQIGGTGVFAQAVRAALVNGGIDIAVHSMKDLPTAPAEGLVIAGIPEREDPRDVLIGTPLADLTDGMRIGTGSPRRSTQLAAHLRSRGITCEFVPIRGNVDRRVGLVSDGTLDATMLAAAGLRRLGRWEGVGQVAGLSAEPLSLDVMVPAAGQGALALEIAASAPALVHEAVARLDDERTRTAVVAERAYLRQLEAGCLAPVGVHGAWSKAADLTLAAVAGRTYVDTSADDASGDLIKVHRRCDAEQAEMTGMQLAIETLELLGVGPPVGADVPDASGERE